MKAKEALDIITTLNELLDMNDYMQAVEALEQALTELEDLKEKVAKLKYYTRLIDFLNVMRMYEWTDEDKIILDVGFVNQEGNAELTIKELREKYADYNVFDYDMYHEITDDNYLLAGYIEIGDLDKLVGEKDE